MDQTSRGRASEHEVKRFFSLLESLPVAEREYKEGILLFEDEEQCSVSLHSLISPSSTSTPDKCTLVFCTLVIEVDKLNNEAVNQLFPALLLYGENGDVDFVDDDASVIRQMSSFVPFLHRLTLFLGRVYQVFRNMLQQLRAFHALSKAEFPGGEERKMKRVWRALGDLLAILMQIDEIMTNRASLKRDFQVYMKAMETAHHSPSLFGVSQTELRPLITVLVTIDAQLMHGNALRNCYEQSFGELDDDSKFSDRMKNILIEMYEHWEKEAVADVADKRRLMIIICLTVFHYLHFGGKEKKLIKTVWGSHKKIIAFHLIGDIVWLPCIFLLKEVPELQSIVDKKSVQLVAYTKSNLYKDQSEGMINEAFSFCGETEIWMAEMRIELRRGGGRDAAMCLQLAEKILKGARLCDTMCRLLRTVLNSQKGDLSMNKTTTTKVFAVIVAIKNVSLLFTNYWSSLLEVCQLACHQWRCHALSIVDHGRSVARENGQMDIVGSLSIVIEALSSTCSPTRLTVVGIALEMGVYKKSLRSNGDGTQLELLMGRMGHLMTPRRLLARVGDCSFLFWERGLLDIYFSTLIEQKPSRDQIQAFMCALSDCAQLTTMAKHCTKDNLLREYQKEIFEGMKNGFLYSMCGDIENDLRVLIHKHLNVDEKDKTDMDKLIFYKSLISSPQLRIYDRLIDVKEFVERYLERTFYNLTVVALHDRHTYSKMGGLAAERYSLTLVDGHLPHFSLEQGLDVIGVMKHLNHFVASYNYSLNQQLFIEKDSCSRTLRVLTAQHMSNSLRSHGMGVLNTCVNVTYQLLRKKMSVFSQFLAEEHIRAQLQREIRYFEENRENVGRMFPVKRAEKFNRAIGQLGMADEENSYLDKFRELVTQIGNALGVVRALTTGASGVTSQMKDYDCVEEGADIEIFLDEEDDSKDHEATKVVRQLLTELREQRNRNSNYIKMLIEVFRKGFLEDSKKHAHLNNFYAIVPPLTVNYVQHMLICRERLRKRSQQGKQMTFTDDGFVMGVAYLTTVLESWSSLASLNWFTSVLKRCAEERDCLGEEQKKNGKETTLNRSIGLKETRLQAYEREFKLLSYTLQSARVFFFSEEDDSIVT